MFQKIVARTDIPKRTDLGNIPRYNAPENKIQLYGEHREIVMGVAHIFRNNTLKLTILRTFNCFVVIVTELKVNAGKNI
ncbi:hypothetical protein C6500_07510 [Candidatus Poribacteria bacterium]|nr:MAG: hypothetical protein C6500_07510 [Candidatus Poribacteria bacterium]